MRSLREGAEDYLALRRGLGFKLKRPARFVRSFVESLEKRGETRITTQLALEWATQPQHLQPSEWAARLSGVRAFARYWSSIDVATEIPPEGLLPFRARRQRPYLYSELEVQRLLQEARSMPAQFSLQPLTYHCLFGLLAVTGLRIGEALNLESRDVNWAEGVLTIRTSKFGKSRLVPLHSTTKDVLSDYALQRIQRFPDRPTSAFFPSRTGAHLDPGQVRRTFYRMSRQIGIRGASASHGPRLHDFRHRADSPVMPTCLGLVPFSPLFGAGLGVCWLVEVGIIRVVFSELALKPIKEKTNVGRVFGAARKRTIARQPAGFAPLTVCSIPGGGRLCSRDDAGKTVVT